MSKAGSAESDPLIPHDLANATKTNHLVRRYAQRDDVLDGRAHVGFLFGSEQNSAGTDVLSKPDCITRSAPLRVMARGN